MCVKLCLGAFLSGIRYQWSRAAMPRSRGAFKTDTKAMFSPVLIDIITFLVVYYL